MTALLVIFAVLAFVAADLLKLWIKRRRGFAQAPAPVRSFHAIRLPNGLFVGNNHSWARLTETGELRLGLDELLTQTVGDIDSIVLPRVGREVRRGETIATISRLGHDIPVTSPVDGTIVSANDSLTSRPFDIASDPYGNGWIANVWPTDHTEALGGLRVGERASAWLKNEVQRLSDFLSMQASPGLVGATLSDGATPIVGVLSALDDQGRANFVVEFLTID